MPKTLEQEMAARKRKKFKKDAWTAPLEAVTLRDEVVVDPNRFNYLVADAVDAAQEVIEDAWKRYRHTCAPASRAKKYEFVARVVFQLEYDFAANHNGSSEEFALFT